MPEGLEPVDGDSFAFASTYGLGDDEPINYVCNVSDVGDGAPRDGHVGGYLLGHVPDGTYRSFVEDSLSSSDIEFGESSEHRGGEIVLYCAEPQGESVEVQTPFCSADWVGDDVLVSVWVTVDPDDLARVQEWLVESLDTSVGGGLATGGGVELD